MRHALSRLTVSLSPHPLPRQDMATPQLIVQLAQSSDNLFPARPSGPPRLVGHAAAVPAGRHQLYLRGPPLPATSTRATPQLIVQLARTNNLFPIRPSGPPPARRPRGRRPSQPSAVAGPRPLQFIVPLARTNNLFPVRPSGPPRARRPRGRRPSLGRTLRGARRQPPARSQGGLGRTLRRARQLADREDLAVRSAERDGSPRHARRADLAVRSAERDGSPHPPRHLGRGRGANARQTRVSGRACRRFLWSLPLHRVRSLWRRAARERSLRSRARAQGLKPAPEGGTRA
jgi:hypothetical protein